jgi:broad specificity phosphatase PhoE
MKIKTPFYFIRHGQTDWNVQGRAMGKQDIPLNQTGQQQAQEAQQLMQNRGIKTICYSPLSRAKETAHIINQALHCFMIEMEELAEINLGDHVGKKRNEFPVDFWAHLKKGINIGNAEPYDIYQERVLTGLYKALEFPGPVLIVSHSGVYHEIQTLLKVEPQAIQWCTPHFHEHCPQNKVWTISIITGPK